MNRWNKFFVYFLLTLLATFNTAIAQDRKQLEQKKKQLQKEIEQANQLLKATEQDKKTSLKAVVNLSKKIAARTELINTIQQEINIINNNIVWHQAHIYSISQEIAKIKADYAKMIQQAYYKYNRKQAKRWILAATNFNQAYKRWRYLQEYTQFRIRQKEKIIATQTELKLQVAQLQSNKMEKDILLQHEANEKKLLTNEKKQQEQIIKQLTQKEQELLAQIKKKQSEAEELQKAIKKIIDEEIRLANERKQKAKQAAEAKGKTKSTATKSTEITQTPEVDALSASFEQNKGKLPWPVEKGNVISTFGEHPHPVLSGITIKNDGIDIATTNNANCRAIFDGKVTGIVNIAGYENVVIIRHGNYLSVYSKLKEVTVKKGQEVQTKQKIGSIAFDSDEKKTVMNFQIRHGNQTLNPQAWLATKN